MSSWAIREVGERSEYHPLVVDHESEGFDGLGDNWMTSGCGCQPLDQQCPALAT